MPDFDTEVFLPEAQTDMAILRLSGSLDSYSLPSLEKKIHQLIHEENKTRVVVNCSKLKFISSPGMGLFLGSLGDLEKRGGRIVFSNVVQPEVHDAMSLLGFFDVFPFFDEEREAMRALHKSL